MDYLTIRQVLAFVLGWWGYAATYFLRKPLGVIKADLQKDLNFSTTQLGWLDTALLLPYAIMQIFLGQLGDKIGARRTFGFALILSGCSVMFFGNSSSFFLFFVMLFLNGSAQSQCWANCTKVLLSWFSDAVKNSVFGMFGTCCFAGGIGGTMLAVYIQAHMGWQQVYFWPSLFVITIGVLVLLMFQQPEEVGIDVPGRATATPKTSSKDDLDKPRLIDLWRIPLIAEVSISIFCLKVVRYCMYMWLPMYLLQSLKYSQSMAGIFSTVFEIGGVTGSALIGFLLDKYYKGRSLRGIGISVFISTAGLIAFMLTASWGVFFNSICLFIAGAFNAGPDILLCGTVPTELVEKRNKNAVVATVALVNGFGSIGTCIEGPVIGFVAAHSGWSGMFVLLIGLASFGTLVTFRAAYKQDRIRMSSVDPISNAV